MTTKQATTTPSEINPARHGIDEQSQLTAQQSLELLEAQLHDQLDKPTAKLQLGSGTPIVLPTQMLELITALLGHMAQGKPTLVVPANVELTTQEAAHMLNVSRPYLVDLLERGDIPHRKVGPRRRVRFADVMEYKARIDAARMKSLDKLAAMSQDLGLY